MTETERLLLEALELQRVLLADIRDALLSNQWPCGCGQINGCNLAVCARCGRAPGAVS